MQLDMQELLSAVSGILGHAIALDAPLMEAGLDSIAAVEVRNAVAIKFGVEVPATVTFDHPSVHALASFVHRKITGPDAIQVSFTMAVFLMQKLWKHVLSIYVCRNSIS